MTRLARLLILLVAARLFLEDFDHVLNGRDTGNRIFGELVTERDRAEQFPVNVDRASAHSLKDASMIQFVAEQLGQDRVLPRIREAFQHAENFEVELLRLAAGKDGIPYRAHSRLDLINREKLGLLRFVLL
ncbi:MAG: hypothetical protein JMDDDDMK_03337 [Acidobacteria bacterium]|nr:hypothetical protein [Acidobacteriota bacterium]